MIKHSLLSQIQNLSLQTHRAFLEEQRKYFYKRTDPRFLKEQAFLSLMEAMRQANIGQGVVR